jgi:hypothetical protein
MTNRIMLAAVTAFILIGIMIGFPIGKGCKQCPEIKVGIETTMVEIVVHDTVIVEKKGKDIIIEKKIVIRDDSNTQDTNVCYSFDETHDDGAYTKCEVCSDNLPVSSNNINGTITYTAPPDTERTIFRVDTITSIKPPPLHKDWKTYVIGALIAITIFLKS